MIKELFSKLINKIEKFFDTRINVLIAELFKSAAVGGIGVIINMTLFYVFTLPEIKKIIPTIVAQIFIHIILITVSFVLQKYYTFKKFSNTGKQMIKFILQSISYFILDTILTMLLYDLLQLHPMIAKFITLFLLFFYSFLTQKLWIFKT